MKSCPKSALLFIMVNEVMAINIRNIYNIQGIDINGYKLKITQYADDTTLYLKDSISLKLTFKLLDHFHSYVGLTLNK